MNVPPSFSSIRFSCPHCGALAHQHWSEIRVKELGKNNTPTRPDKARLEVFQEEQAALEADKQMSDLHLLDEFLRATTKELFVSNDSKSQYTNHVYNLEISTCDSCGDIALWSGNVLIYPVSGPAGQANKDMPHMVKSLFDEASSVFQTSPRAAAALLRLALQHLMMEVGQSGKNINSDINILIENGLDPDIAKMMHSVRIIGNESVHPGVIDVNDEPYVAEIMFDLLNQIVEQIISRPKRHEKLWQKLPEDKRKEVEKTIEKAKKK